MFVVLLVALLPTIEAAPVYGNAGYSMTDGASGTLGTLPVTVSGASNTRWTCNVSPPAAAGCPNTGPSFNAGELLFPNSATPVRTFNDNNFAQSIAATWFTGSSMTFTFPAGASSAVVLSAYVLDFDSNNARAQSMVICNLAGMVCAASTTVTNFKDGKWVRFYISAATRAAGFSLVVALTGTPNAVVSGVFFDAPPPSGPCSAASTDRELCATDTVTRGAWLPAASVASAADFCYALPGGGDWITRQYGNLGFALPVDMPTCPTTGFQPLGGMLVATAMPFVVATPPLPATFHQLWSCTAGLQRPTGTVLPVTASATLLATAWFEWTAFDIYVAPTSLTSPYDIILYLLDFDNKGRRERIDILDMDTNALLASYTTTSSFVSGLYVQFAVTGKIIVRATLLAGDNAVISGLFFNTPGNSNLPCE